MFYQCLISSDGRPYIQYHKPTQKHTAPHPALVKCGDYLEDIVNLPNYWHIRDEAMGTIFCLWLHSSDHKNGFKFTNQPSMYKTGPILMHFTSHLPTVSEPNCSFINFIPFAGSFRTWSSPYWPFSNLISILLLLSRAGLQPTNPLNPRHIVPSAP